MNYKQCAKSLLTHENILIVTHRNPDGDTVGSAAALCSALQRGGRTAWMFPNEQINRKFRPFCEKFFAPEGFVPRYVVAVDTAEPELLSRGFAGPVDLCLDHHPSNSGYAKESFVKPEKAACAQIVLDVIRNMNGDVTKEEATLLYIGLSTDTGCFRYSNTDAACFRAASELLHNGADSETINTVFFRKSSAARLKLESMVYDRMRSYRDGKIVFALITKEMLAASGVQEEDMDDLASLASRVEGGELAITIREGEEGQCKVSVRSSDAVSSNEICAVFGGGGHMRAAGCTIKGSPEKVCEMLLNVIDEVWK